MSDWVVRRAQESDKEWVLAQCKQFASEVGVGYNEAHLLKLWDIPEIVSLIVWQGGVRCGLAVYSIAGHPFNPDVKTFTELVLWVVPEKRKTKAAFILLDVMDTLSNSCQLSIFSVPVKGLINKRALTKRGFVEHEQTFIRRT